MKKCIFRDEDCIYGYNDCHDDCGSSIKSCRKVPNMTFSDDTEMRILCSVGGKREKQTDFFGIVGAKIPKWYENILDKDEYKNQIPPSCLDHRRTLKKTAIIGEPYHLYMNDFVNLINYCKQHDLTFRVDGNSAHVPGRCFRVIINKKKD